MNIEKFPSNELTIEKEEEQIPEKENKKNIMKLSEAESVYFSEDLQDKLDEYKEILKNSNIEENRADTYNYRIAVGETLLKKGEVNIEQLAKEMKERKGEQFDEDHFRDSIYVLKIYYNDKKAYTGTPFKLEDRLRYQENRIEMLKEKQELEKRSSNKIIKFGSSKKMGEEYWQQEIQKAEDKRIELERKLKNRRNEE